MNDFPVSAAPVCGENERIDDLQIGGMRLIQNTKGFCFGIDAVLLSDFADICERDSVLDLCTGTGIIPVLLAAKKNAAEICGVEIQHDAVLLAKRNISLNNLANVKVIEADLNCAADFLPRAHFDHITCNPPYKRRGSGIVNPHDSKAIARHEVLCTLEDVVRVSASLLKLGGKLSMIHRPDRLSDVFSLMREYKIEPKRLRLVYPSEGKNANMLLIEGVKGGGAFMKVLPPLYVYENGHYTEEIDRIYGRDA